MRIEILKEHEPFMDTTYFWIAVDGKKEAVALTEEEAHQKIKKKVGNGSDVGSYLHRGVLNEQ